MIVGLDIDGVLADFLSPFLRRLEKKIGNGPINADSITDFKFSDHPVLSDEVVWDCLQEVSYEPDFWQSLSSLISAKEWAQLEHLSNERRLFFITHRYVRDTYDIHRVTSGWLKKHGIKQPVIHFTNESKSDVVGHLGIQFFMDDRYENCQDVAENTKAVVLMPHRPYNRSFNHPAVKRIHHFSELFTHLAPGTTPQRRQQDRETTSD